MLTHLSIKNYALIDSLEVDFGAGFSVVTGETGAGKSIILGALSLILGQRADVQSFKNKEKKCVIEGTFDVDDLHLMDFFTSNELDYETKTILRREISASGKSRAFINDTPVNLNLLKDLAVKLVDIHSQHKTISLQDADFQLEVLDSFAGLDDETLDYQTDFNHWNGLKRDLKQKEKEEEKARGEQDFYQFQFDELMAAKLTVGEQEEIEEALSVLNHVGEIKTRLNNSLRLLSDEDGLMEKLADLTNELNAIQSFKSEFQDFYKRVQSNFLDMQDITREIERFEELVEMDPDRTDELNERLNLLYQLQQKHRCDTVEDLIKVKSEYDTKLSDFSSIEDKIQILKKELSKIDKSLNLKATIISEKRKQAKVELEKEVLFVVKDLGLSKASFVVEIVKADELSEKGIDQVGFLFNANPGGEPMEISRVASGGELSRLMLAIKSIVATKKLLSTIIFDEIDSGVSGEIAGKMGAIMQAMAKNLQIISITHVPQIAARGDQHYLVYKEQLTNSTNTFLKQLSEDDRIVEIAKMLSDTKVSLSAVETARELLNN
jgi:DNA repair protein RecN (Recombination protein N)